MKILMIAVATLLLITGCATSNYVELKNENILNVPLGKARVLIYRPSTFIGVGMNPPIAIDNKVIGESISGTVFYVDVNASEHEFYIPSSKYSTLAGIAGGALGAMIVGADYIKEDVLVFNVGANELICIKNSISSSFQKSMAGKMDFTIVDCENAKDEMKDLKKISF